MFCEASVIQPSAFHQVLDDLCDDARWMPSLAQLVAELARGVVAYPQQFHGLELGDQERVVLGVGVPDVFGFVVAHGWLQDL